MTDYSRLQGSSVQALATNLREFQTSIRKLKSIVSQGTDRDAFSHEKDHAQKLSKGIMQDLRVRPTKSSERVQFEKLAKEFEQLLSQFTELTQSFINKEKTILTLSRGSEALDDLPEQEHQKRESFEFKYAGGLEDINFNQREEEVRALEKDMQEINLMFNDVARMVDEQGGHLDEADKEMDTAVLETDKATVEITKAEAYQRAARRKMIWIIVIVSAIIIVIVAVIVGLFH